MSTQKRAGADNAEVVAALVRMIRARGAAVAREDPEHLAQLAILQREVQDALRVAVEGQRSHGMTDGQIAAALGVTRQAVEARWPRRAKANPWTGR
jgi:hypothetical protein